MSQPQPGKTVWIYDAGNGKTIEFETADKARAWFEINDPEGVAFEHPSPDSDPNEAYEVVPMKPDPHGPPGDWWTVTRNGIPDRHFSASRKAEAERYASSGRRKPHRSRLAMRRLRLTICEATWATQISSSAPLRRHRL